jgi:hypothetical protein
MIGLMPSKRAIGLLLSISWAIGFSLMACSSPVLTEGDQLDSLQQQIVTSDTTTPAPDIDDEVQELSADPETDECLECHTDKDRLIQSSDPIEEVESEDSGEG